MDDFKTSSQGVGTRPKVVRVSESSMMNGTSNWYNVLGSSRMSVLNNPNTRSASVGTLVILTFVAPTIRAHVVNGLGARYTRDWPVRARRDPKIARPGRR